MKNNGLASAYIYGAGKGCEELFDIFDICSKYTITGIIDIDEKKRGKRYSVKRNNLEEQFLILSPEDIMPQNDALIIISVRLSSVLDAYRLVISKGVKEEKILYYDREKQNLLRMSEAKYDLVANEIEREYHVTQIQFAMLCESFFDGEFSQCKTVAIIGRENDIRVMKCFMDKLAPDFEVICLNAVDEKNQYDKSVFVSSDYMFQVAKYESLYDDKKWLVLPFYDVENCVF